MTILVPFPGKHCNWQRSYALPEQWNNRRSVYLWLWDNRPELQVLQPPRSRPYMRGKSRDVSWGVRFWMWKVKSYMAAWI